MMKTQTTNRRWLAGLACVCAAALALWACKEDDPQPDPPTLSLSMSGATGATDAVSVSRADGTGDLQWPQGKTLGRTFTVALSAAAPGEVTVGLSLVRSDNVPAGSVALSPETVRIPAGQTSGTATVTVSDADAFLRAGGTFEVGVRTGAVSGAQAPTQPLEAKVVATVASFSPDLTMAVQGVGAGGADSFTATRSPDADCAVTFPEGKSLSRTVTLTLSAPATTDAVVSLALTRNNLSEEQAKLSAATVTIAAGQTSGTATVTGPEAESLGAETTEKTYGWTVAVSAVEGIAAPATLPRATVAVTVPACEKKEEPKEEECTRTKVTITYTNTVADVIQTTKTETQCVEVTVDKARNTYTFKQLKIDNVTKDWTVMWEDLDGWSGLYGECTVTEGDSYEDEDKCWRYSITGDQKPTVENSKVTKFKAAIGRLETDNPEDLLNEDIVVIDRKIGEITIGE